MVEAADAEGPDGLGGAACKVVPETVTPADTSGVGLLLIAQIRKEYCVPADNPVTECDVPEIDDSEIVVPLAQFAGAVSPD